MGTRGHDSFGSNMMTNMMRWLCCVSVGLLLAGPLHAQKVLRPQVDNPRNLRDIDSDCASAKSFLRNGSYGRIMGDEHIAEMNCLSAKIAARNRGWKPAEQVRREREHERRMAQLERERRERQRETERRRQEAERRHQQALAEQRELLEASMQAAEGVGENIKNSLGKPQSPLTSVDIAKGSAEAAAPIADWGQQFINSVVGAGLHEQISAWRGGSASSGGSFGAGGGSGWSHGGSGRTAWADPGAATPRGGWGQGQAAEQLIYDLAPTFDALTGDGPVDEWAIFNQQQAALERYISSGAARTPAQPLPGLQPSPRHTQRPLAAPAVGPSLDARRTIEAKARAERARAQAALRAQREAARAERQRREALERARRRAERERVDGLLAGWLDAAGMSAGAAKPGPGQGGGTNPVAPWRPSARRFPVPLPHAAGGPLYSGKGPMWGLIEFLDGGDTAGMDRFDQPGGGLGRFDAPRGKGRPPAGLDRFDHPAAGGKLDRFDR